MSKMSHLANALASSPPIGRPTRRSAAAKRSWSVQRRARQAQAIRSWQPWRKSTGPKTAEGKARSSQNALKHGYKSRAYIERQREDRRILAVAARNIAIAKTFLRALAAARSAPPVCFPPPRAGEVARSDGGATAAKSSKGTHSLLPTPYSPFVGV